MRISVFLIIIILTGCYSQPRNKSFTLYGKKSNKNFLKTNGVYYEFHKYGEKQNIDKTILKFYNDNSVQLIVYDSMDTTLIETIKLFDNQKKKNNKIDKGFYYIDESIIKIEILYGFGYGGYHFLYYSGKFNSNGELVLDYLGSKPYKKPRYNNSIRESSPYPKIMKFYPIKDNDNKNSD